MTLALGHVRRIQGKNLPQKYHKSLVKYLLSIDSWGIYELRLFSNAMFIFDSPSLIPLAQTAIDRSKYYLKLPGYSDLLSTILSNALELLIENHDLESARKLIIQTKDSLNFEEPTQSKIKIVFLETLIAEQQNSELIDPTSPETVIAACYSLKAINWSNALNQYLQSWRKTHH